MAVKMKHLRLGATITALIMALTACAALTNMSGPEKMALGCDAASQVIEGVNDIIMIDIVKVNNGEEPVLSLADLDKFEISKDIVVSYCTADNVNVAEGLPAVLREYSKMRLLKTGGQ